uniref:Uncharacterized protein n=1 Tax=Anguilla anguilla TaxID=7936 RepID=A0A0E9X5Y4_ANGAN
MCCHKNIIINIFQISTNLKKKKIYIYLLHILQYLIVRFYLNFFPINNIFDYIF